MEQMDLHIINVGKINFSPASFLGQWIVAAAKPYFAKQSMERAICAELRKSPIFKLTASGG